MKKPEQDTQITNPEIGTVEQLKKRQLYQPLVLGGSCPLCGGMMMTLPHDNAIPQGTPVQCAKCGATGIAVPPKAESGQAQP